MSAEKRKRAQYTITEKLQLVNRIRKGESQAQVSRATGIADSTLRGWLKEEAKLRSFLDETDSKTGLCRKRAKTSQNPDLDSAVYNWFAVKRSEGVPISGPILQAQAMRLSNSSSSAPTSSPAASTSATTSTSPTGPTSPTANGFRASNGWLCRWQKRHGISAIKVSGEIRSADEGAAKAFQPELKALVEEHGLGPDQIFNTDETGLFFKMTPERTLASRTDATSRHGHKQRKDRVTILLTCSWAGHKLKPLMVGKARSPRYA